MFAFFPIEFSLALREERVAAILVSPLLACTKSCNFTLKCFTRDRSSYIYNDSNNFNFDATGYAAATPAPAANHTSTVCSHPGGAVCVCVASHALVATMSGLPQAVGAEWPQCHPREGPRWW